MLAVAVLLLGAGLSGLALWTLYLARAAEQRFPPVGRFVDAAGYRLHYLDSAPENPGKPTVVLIHGSHGVLQDWTLVIERLAPEFRVLAFDRPGHGYSDALQGEAPTPAAQARVLMAGLDRLGIERPIVAGFSWGGAVAAACALEHPGAVAAIVVVAAALYDWQAPVDATYRIAELPVLGPLFVHTLVMPVAALLADRLGAGVFAPGPVPRAFAEAPLALAARPATFKVTSQERVLLKPFLAGQKERYPSLAAPLVILAGDADRIVSPALHSYRLHAALPDSELIVLPGAGHALPYSHPDAVAAAIRKAALATRPGRPAGIPQ